MIFHNNEHQCVMAEFHYESQEMVPIGPTAVRSQHSTGPGELYVPGGVFHFVAGGVEIEGGAGSGVDVQWYVTFRLNFHRFDLFELDLRGHTQVWGAVFSCLRLKWGDMVLI